MAFANAKLRFICRAAKRPLRVESCLRICVSPDIIIYKYCIEKLLTQSSANDVSFNYINPIPIFAKFSYKFYYNRTYAGNPRNLFFCQCLLLKTTIILKTRFLCISPKLDRHFSTNIFL